MPAPDSEENWAFYPHRRHSEGPALVAPLLFHQHLVDTAELWVTWPTLQQAAPQWDGLLWRKKHAKCRGPGEEDQGVQREPTSLLAPELWSQGSTEI